MEGEACFTFSVHCFCSWECCPALLQADSLARLLKRRLRLVPRQYLSAACHITKAYAALSTIATRITKCRPTSRNRGIGQFLESHQPSGRMALSTKLSANSFAPIIDFPLEKTSALSPRPSWFCVTNSVPANNTTEARCRRAALTPTTIGSAIHFTADSLTVTSMDVGTTIYAACFSIAAMPCAILMTVEVPCRAMLCTLQQHMATSLSGSRKIPIL